MADHINVNGRRIDMPPGGRSVRISGDRVYIDGVEQDLDGSGPDARRIVELHVHGNVAEVSSEASVVVHLEAGGSVACGAVTGSIEADGSVKCDDVGGNVKAGGSVQCGNVAGNVKAGGSVVHR